MTDELTGKRIAFLVANAGVEEVELTSPWQAVKEAGGEPVLLAPRKEPVKTVHHDEEPGDSHDPDHAVNDVSAADFAGLVLPGGVANPDKLRVDETAMEVVQDFLNSEKLVAAICHGPWLLVQAGACDGRRMTSYPSIRADVENAGADWVDEEVVQDGHVVTSRNPKDLPAFSARIIAELESGNAAQAAQ